MRWYENDTFWADTFDVEYTADKINDAVHESHMILSLTNFDGDRILDLCCGGGRHAVAFAASGFDVTGVDISPFMLSSAKEYARTAAEAVEFIQGDAREVTFDKPFDMAYCVFNSFGYADDPEHDASILRNAYNCLKKDGVFLLECTSKEAMAKHGAYETISESDDGQSKIVYESTVTDNFSVIENTWTCIHDGEMREYHSRFRLYSASEMYSMFEYAGFKNIQVYGDWDGRPYDHGLERMICVGEK